MLFWSICSLFGYHGNSAWSNYHHLAIRKEHFSFSSDVFCCQTLELRSDLWCSLHKHTLSGVGEENHAAFRAGALPQTLAVSQIHQALLPYFASLVWLDSWSSSRKLTEILCSSCWSLCTSTGVGLRPPNLYRPLLYPPVHMTENAKETRTWRAAIGGNIPFSFTGSLRIDKKRWMKWKRS